MHTEMNPSTSGREMAAVEDYLGVSDHNVEDDLQCYSELKDLRIRLDFPRVVGPTDGFSLCFWLYLSSSARPSAVVLRQMILDQEGEIPFIALVEENKLMLFPLMMLHEDAPSSRSLFPWTDLPHVASLVECPLEKWFHVGCEIAANYTRFHVNGTLVGEKSLSSRCDNSQGGLNNILLAGNGHRDKELHGYVYSYQLLTLPASITDHFIKNPPMKLSLDTSYVFDGIEEGDDGVWSIIGGKVSCRRIFSLEVVLLDALGRSVHRELEISASLIYADNEAPVKRSRDEAEAPLLLSNDGLEIPSTSREIVLLNGRASFNLKISQLSSKCDNRLFRICFCSTHSQRYPFFKALTPPIRCISRNRNVRPPLLMKRPRPLCGASFPVANDSCLVSNASGDAQLETLNECKSSPLMKCLTVGLDRTSLELHTGGELNQNATVPRTASEAKLIEGTDSAPSDSESTGAPNSESERTEDTLNPISDLITFRYCLEGTYERLLLLKEIVVCCSNQAMEIFAEQVCAYTGCCHHRSQIMMSKQLVLEGADAWKSMAHNNHRILWKDAIPEINRRFMGIVRSPSRGLSVQDLEVLRGIAGCVEEMNRENFDKMWCWLFPVALALSKDHINSMWNCMSAKWIEGLITKEEAENSLKDHRGGPQKPGTFVLRFPTSRSWPHPDAGSLVVTYVGFDYAIHHRLLSDWYREIYRRPLQDLLLEEPELNRLGRVMREVVPFGRCEE